MNKDIIQKSIECDKELRELDTLLSTIKPQRKRHEAIKEARAKAWKESLEKAEGNKEKAIEIFDEIYP